MKKSVVKALSLFFALALILSALPVAAFAEEHVHNYVVTTETFKNVWYNNTFHGTCVKNQYRCACGEIFYKSHFYDLLLHTAVPGSAVNLGTHLGPDGGTFTTYRYTCKVCGGTFTMDVAS